MAPPGDRCGRKSRGRVTCARMTARKCAYLTMQDQGDYVTDYDVSFDAMATLGWDVDVVAWRDASIDWDNYDAVYICTPWDYPQHKEQFIEVLQSIENSAAVLVNPLPLATWSLNKTYLRDLERRGADIVPSIWFDTIEQQQIAGWFDQLRADKLVIKPTVGANAQDAFVLINPVPQEMQLQLLATFRERPFFVQPFIENIMTEGEYSLFYFGGEYSHAIQKIPKSGDFRVQEEYGGDIRSVQPAEKLLAAGRQVLSLVEPQPVYMRADFVRDAADTFRLMELELVEPSLYLRTNSAAAQRFAVAFDNYVRGEVE